MRSRTVHAFTLIELLVVVGVMSVLIVIMLPSIGAARATSRRTACAANLHSIGRAMMTYAVQEGSYPTNLPPVTLAKVGTWRNPPKANGADDGMDPLNTLFNIATAPGDPSVNEWILVLQGSALPKQFICGGDPQNPTAAQLRYEPTIASSGGLYLNFGTIDYMIGGGKTSSYAFAYPWSKPTTAVPRWWKGDGDVTRPLGADIGPSMSPPLDDPTAAPGRVSNSKNHNGMGQNVLFADGHVDFAKQNGVGRGGDNIYTGDGGNIFVVAGGAKLNQITSLNANPSDVILTPANP